MRAKPIDDVRREQRLHLEEVAVVDDPLDDAVHVVRLVRRIGDDGVEPTVVVGDLELDLGVVDRGIRHVVVGQERDEGARVVERVGLVAREVVRDARDRVVRERAAELLHADVLAGDGLDDVGAGDEHLAGLVDHDDEVGEGGGVDRAARRGAAHDRDLRDHAGCRGVAPEDLAVLAERDHALLDARAAGVEDADDRHARLQRELHDLDDLLAGDLAERAAEDREVLRVHGDLTAVDRARARDDGVAVGALGLHAERVRAVSHELVELDERTGVEQLGDALAGRHLALGVLLLDRRLAGRGHGFVIALLEVGELAGGRGEVGAVSRFGHAVHSTGEHPGRFVDGFLQIRPPTWCIPVTRGTGRLSAWTFR